MSQEQYDSKGAAGDVIGMHINYTGSDSGVSNGDGTSDADRYVPLPLLKGEDGTRWYARTTHIPATTS